MLDWIANRTEQGFQYLFIIIKYFSHYYALHVARQNSFKSKGSDPVNQRCKPNTNFEPPLNHETVKKAATFVLIDIHERGIKGELLARKKTKTILREESHWEIQNKAIDAHSPTDSRSSVKLG